MRSSKRAIASLVFLGLIAVVYCRGAPPKFIKRPKHVYWASVGDRVKLKCRVTGTNDPLHNRTYSAWIKYRGGNTTVVSAKWERFQRINGRHLKISNVKLTDAGKYLCLASNLHGRINATIRLIVQESSNTSIYNTEAMTPTPPTNVPDKNQPPVFRRRERNKKPFRYNGRPGVLLKLRCHANGSPKLKIRWYLNNRKLSPRMRTYLVSDGWAMSFDKLRESHTGRYKCVVRNQFGIIEKMFIIKPLKSLQQSTTPNVRKADLPFPTIKKQLLKNMTAEQGTDVTFTCTAESDLPLRFNWLKWNPVNNRTNASVNPASVVRVLNASEPRIRFIRESSHWGMESKQTYCHKLKLLNISDTDQGRYTCVVGSKAGFVSHSVFLTVKPTRESRPQVKQQDNNSSNPKRSSGSGIEIPLAALIGVPVAFGTILIVAIIWCYVQIIRHRARQEMKAKTVSYAVDNVYGRQVYTDNKRPTENGITVNRLATLEELSKLRLAEKGETDLITALRNGDVRIDSGHVGAPKPVALQNGVSHQNGVILHNGNVHGQHSRQTSEQKLVALQNGIANQNGVFLHNGSVHGHVQESEQSEFDDAERRSHTEKPRVENGGTGSPLRTPNTYVDHAPVIDRRAELCRENTDDNTRTDFSGKRARAYSNERKQILRRDSDMDNNCASEHQRLRRDSDMDNNSTSEHSVV